MTSSSIMYDNNESYIAVEQPKNLIVWKNILKKAQKKFHIDKNQYPQWYTMNLQKKILQPTHHKQIIRWKKWEECHHTLPKIGGDTMQE